MTEHKQQCAVSGVGSAVLRQVVSNRMQRLLLAGAFVLAALSPVSAVNPITRFGKCKPGYTPDVTIDSDDMTGVWYLQQKPKNPDNFAHTCQAQNEVELTYYTSFLYYYSIGEAINRPIQAQYASVSPGKYRGAITVDGEAVNVFLYFLYLNKEAGVRTVYMCTDNKKANSNIDAILVSTRDQIPLKKNLNKGIKAAEEAYRAVNGKNIVLEQVVQDRDKCEPLVVYESFENPLLLS